MDENAKILRENEKQYRDEVHKFRNWSEKISVKSTALFFIIARISLTSKENLLIQHLKDLKAGKAVNVPVYSYVEHTRTGETTEFTPKRIVILEGILLLTDERVRQLADISVFVDTPLDICFIRRLQRDMEERGRSLQSVIDQYRATVRPMFLQFIEPSKQYADIVIPRGGKNRIAINMLKAQILHLLNQK